MNGTAFDALAASETLAQAGFDERQAVDADRDKLATKADLSAGLAALEARLTVRMVAMGGVIVAVMAALKLFA